MRIIKLLLQRPIGAVMLWLTIVIGGIWVGIGMDIDFLPNLNVPKLTVIAPYQGMPAQEIRSLVTIPLEESLSSISGLKNINSISRDGLSIIELEFPWGIDRLEAVIRTRETIDMAWQRLPSKAAKPQVLAIDPGDVPIITLGVFPKNDDLMLARRISDRELRARLQKIEGVGSVQVSGGLVEEILVRTDADAAAGLGYTLSAIAGALESSNIDYPSGTITEGSTEYLVKTRARAESIAELSEIYLPPVLKEHSSAVRLKDIAVLERASRERTSVFYCATEDSRRTSSIEGVRIQIRRQNGYSPLAMAQNLLRDLPEIERSFGRSLEIKIISDRSKALKISMNNLVISLTSGAVFAFLVILLFMKNLKRALILLVSLPSSLLLAVLLLFLCGKSLNLMSLGGLALGVGMVVDNSIVITERLSRKLQRTATIKKRREQIAQATAELAPSLAGATITTVIVFMPLLFVPGLAGALFGDLGLSVILALSASLAAALSLIPVLYLVLNPAVSELKSGNNCFVLLRKILRFSLRKPLPVLIAVIIIFAAGILPIMKLPIEVVSPINEGMLQASVRLPPGTSLAAVSRLAKELSSVIINDTAAFMVSSRAGGEQDDPYYLASTEESAQTIQLEIFYPVKTGYEGIAGALTDLLDISGCTSLIQPPENILEDLIGGSSFPEWIIRGDKPSSLRKTAAEISDKIPGASLLPADEKTILKVYPDREALASFGIDITDLAGQLSGAIYGSVPAKLIFENREVEVRLRAEDGLRRDRSGIDKVTIPNSEGQAVRMQAIAEVRQESALPWFLRKNRKDISVIRLETQADERVRAVLKGSGAEIREKNLLLENVDDLILTFILAGILLFLCLGIQFESISIPLLLMLSIPPGAAGIITALFVFDSSLTLNSCLGILAVMGISVNNGILLYEESRRLLHADGALPVGALYRGTSSRLRPIIMTGLTTVTALIPLAVNPYGTSSQSSLAIAVIGGLTVSTILSLLIIPNILRISLLRDNHENP